MKGYIRKVGLCLIATLFSVVAQAYDLYSGGVYYNLNQQSKTATVTTGDALYSGEVTIPATLTIDEVTYRVTAIANEAFKNCIHLTAVNIGSNVATIGVGAFYGCEEMEEIVIPNSVTTIASNGAGYSNTFVGCTTLRTVTLGGGITVMGDRLFKNCQNLASVTITDGCEIIAPETFSGCSKLSQIVIPNSVISIGSEAFKSCTMLTKVVIGDGVTTIGSSAFEGCIRINDLTIGNNVRSIGVSAFANCTSLEEVILTDNIVTFEQNGAGNSYTFNGCTSLESVTLGSKIAEMGYGLFKGNTSLKYVMIKNGCSIIGDGCFVGCTKLASLSIPSSVTKIGYEAFKGCLALSQISVPNSVLSIGSGAFYNCTALTNATIGDGVTSIGYEAFYGCNHLATATLGNEVRSIGYRAFANCTELEEIVLTNNVVTLTQDGAGRSQTFMNCTNLSSVTLGKKLAEMGAGAFLNCTNLRTINILSGCSLIGESCFKGCTKIANVSFPNTVENIGNEAFSGCIALTSLSIPESVITIGSDAFNGCKEMTVATIGNGVTSIGAGAFYQCIKLEDVHLGSEVKTLGCRAFAYCTDLASINLTDKITTFGSNGAGISETFVGCTSLDNIVLGKRVTTMGTGVFLNCTGLTTATIHDGCEVIGETCFKGCTKLESIDIPNSVLTIGESAFEGCTALESATIGDGVTSIGASAFYGCENMTNLSLGMNLRTIGVGAFYGCKALTEVVIPDWVTTLSANGAGSANTFRDCTALQKVTLGKRITSIGENVFQDCPNLETVTAKMAEPVTVNANVFPLRQQETLYVVDAEAKALYSEANVWKEFGNILVMAEELEQTLSYTMPTKTYGDDAFTLPATTNEGLALTWTSGNTSIATISDNTLTIKNAGSATITASQAGNSSYQSFSKNFILTVDKAELTVTADDCSKTQGEENPELTVSYSGFKYDDDATSLTTQPTVTTTATKDSPVGTYPITVSGAESDNYDFTYVSGTLTVNEKAPTVNLLYPVAMTVRDGDSKDMSICLENDDQIIMFEFYMQLPEGLHINMGANGKYVATLNADRTDGHSLEVKKGEDGLYHFLCFSSGNKPFLGNEGELLNVSIGCDEGVEAGTYQGIMTNVLLSDADKNAIELEDVTFDIEVVDYTLGDLTGDGKINGMDIVEMVSLVMESGYMPAADLYPVGNPDGVINGMDLVMEVELVMSQSATQNAPAVTATMVRQLTLSENGAGVKTLGIDASEQFILAQMTVELSAGMTLDDVASDRSHTTAFRQIAGNRYAVVCYSNRNAAFDSNASVLSFHYTGSGELTVSDVMLVSADKQEYRGVVKQDMTTGINDASHLMDNGQWTMDHVYDLQGRQIESSQFTVHSSQLKKGVYIVNGQKMVIR